MTLEDFKGAAHLLNDGVSKSGITVDESFRAPSAVTKGPPLSRQQMLLIEGLIKGEPARPAQPGVEKLHLGNAHGTLAGQPQLPPSPTRGGSRRRHTDETSESGDSTTSRPTSRMSTSRRPSRRPSVQHSDCGSRDTSECGSEAGDATSHKRRSTSRRRSTKVQDGEAKDPNARTGGRRSSTRREPKHSGDAADGDGLTLRRQSSSRTSLREEEGEEGVSSSRSSARHQSSSHGLSSHGGGDGRPGHHKKPDSHLVLSDSSKRAPAAPRLPAGITPAMMQRALSLQVRQVGQAFRCWHVFK